MKKWIWTIVIILVVVIVLGFLGLFPGISTLLGANKPKDLGIKYSQADLQKGREQTGVMLGSDPVNGKTISFEGSKDISGQYSSEMITAMIGSAKYKYYPLKNTQIRINPDGTVEASGVISISKVGQWSTDLGASEGLVSQAKSYIGIISPSPSFYLAGTMSVVDNQISLNISKAQISRFSAPKSIIDQYQGQLADFVEERIANINGMQVRSAKFENSQLVLDANYPATEKSLK